MENLRPPTPILTDTPSGLCKLLPKVSTQLRDRRPSQGLILPPSSLCDLGKEPPLGGDEPQPSCSPSSGAECETQRLLFASQDPGTSAVPAQDGVE